MTRNEKMARDIILNDDGYYVYWPEGYQGGYLNEDDILEIYNKMHEMNKEWDAIVQKEVGDAHSM